MKKVCTKCKVNKALEDYYRGTGHKDGRQSECKGCTITRVTKYNINRKQEYLEYQKEYARSDKGKLTQAKYQKSDKGKVARVKATAKYIKSGKGKLTQAEYNKSVKGKATHAKHMRTDKGKATAARSYHSRTTNISNTINTLTDKEFNYIVVTLQNNQCIGPDHEGSRYFTDKVKPQRDHINPVSKGGDFTVYTVQALCQSCNSKKNVKIIDYRTDAHKEIIKTI